MNANKSPLSIFFSLGDKVTGGDPIKKLDFDYYLMWAIFLAFCFVAFGNIKNFVLSFYTESVAFHSFGWAIFSLAIIWFQYFNLKNFWSYRSKMKEAKENAGKSISSEIESVHDMLKGGVK
jgi:hypothetical protein